MSVNQTPEVLPIVLKAQGLVVENTSTTVLWEGLQALHFRAPAVEPDVAPTAQASVETIVLMSGGEAGSVMFSDCSRWYRQTVAVGAVGIFPRNQPFRAAWAKPVDNFIFYPTLEVLNQVALETHSGEPRAINIGQLGLTNDLTLAQIGWTLLDLLYNTDQSARLYAEALGVTLAHHLLYKFSERPRLAILPAALSNHELQWVIEYINTHFQRDLSLAEIANSAGFSVPHFSRLFRKATGYSPYQYLIRCRVQKAYALLKSHPYSISEVAQMVGFYDHSHLLRHFKRIYGVSPKRIKE
ncbi:MAG: AraC family transcriptional regulator [bacterium]|nr:AraC family transcriptional regulator [bacterium]